MESADSKLDGEILNPVDANENTEAIATADKALVDKDPFMKTTKTIDLKGNDDDVDDIIDMLNDGEDNVHQFLDATTGEKKHVEEKKEGKFSDDTFMDLLISKIVDVKTSRRTTDEWDNDDDSGYYMLPLSDEEFNSLEEVNLFCFSLFLIFS